MQYIGYIYLTTNLVNGKQYVGQHLSKHFDKNYKGSGMAVKSAFEKYGFRNFDCVVLCWCSTQQQLNSAEDNCIKLYNTMYPNGYNLKGGGANGKYSEHARKNLSKSHKNPNVETRKNYSNGQKARFLKQEEHEKASKAHKGQTAWNKGKTGCFSKEAINKMKKAKVGKTQTNGFKKGHTPWNKGKTKEYHLSENGRKNISLAKKGHPNRYFGKQVYQYDKNLNLVKIWSSAAEAGQSGFNTGSISACCNGKQKTHKGFVWSFTPL